MGWTTGVLGGGVVLGLKIEARGGKIGEDNRYSEVIWLTKLIVMTVRRFRS